MITYKGLSLELPMDAKVWKDHQKFKRLRERVEVFAIKARLIGRVLKRLF